MTKLMPPDEIRRFDGIPLVKLGYNDFDLFAKIKYSDSKQIQIEFKDTFVENFKVFFAAFCAFLASIFGKSADMQ
jgi:hypothetical protein